MIPHLCGWRTMHLLRNSDLSKNDTRISSLLGTWTAQTHLKADIGSYELLAYFVIHFMPNPLRGYGCSLSDCNEDLNQVCEKTALLHNKPTCQTMLNNSLQWSDVNAFIYFGARVDVGFPFNKHTSQDTGGWVGPFSLIMARNSSLSIKDGNNEEIIDQYFARYVETASTTYLQMPEDCSLVREEDFRKMAGDIAVQETVTAQYDPNGDQDPYQKYLSTCSNGDVKPLLPLFKFDFVRNDINSEETVEVKLNYKLLTVPRKKDYMYSIYPKIQNRFNNAGLGFKISGPYCYAGDPHRGYSFDMDFDTRDPKKMIHLEHGCIEGLPCAPPAAELYIKSSGNGIHIHPKTLPDDSDTIKLKSVLLQITIISSLLMCIACLIRSNYRLRREASLNQHDNNPTDGGIVAQDDDDNSSIIEEENNEIQDLQQDDLEADSATTPLLSKSEEKWDTDAL